MREKTNIQLTAAEMTSLWSQYINDTLVICINRYFLEKVEDEEIRPIIESTLETARENISLLEELFTKEDFPVPIGFTEEDVNVNAPRLFTDTFILKYLHQMSNFINTIGSATLMVVTRPDVVAFHKRVLNKGVELLDKTRTLMLDQGIYVKPPSISTPDQVDFVKKQHFLAGFFGKKRALTSAEITHLYINIQTNSIGKDLIMGFAQTSQNKEIKAYFSKGKVLSQKYVDIFSEFLTKDDLPASVSGDSHVLDTTTNVFSEKLMMYHVTTLVAGGIGNFGTALAASHRRDVGAKYASLIPEITLYAEDGANLMIKNGWMEEPPQADDRDELTKKA